MSNSYNYKLFFLFKWIISRFFLFKRTCCLLLPLALSGSVRSSIHDVQVCFSVELPCYYYCMTIYVSIQELIFLLIVVNLFLLQITIQRIDAQLPGTSCKKKKNKTESKLKCEKQQQHAAPFSCHSNPYLWPFAHVRW